MSTYDLDLKNVTSAKIIKWFRSGQ